MRAHVRACVCVCVDGGISKLSLGKLGFGEKMLGKNSCWVKKTWANISSGKKN